MASGETPHKSCSLACAFCDRSCAHLHADLRLYSCSFPAVALPLLRNPMLALRDLYLDVKHAEGMVGNSTLEPLLLVLLCRPHTGAPPLRSLTVIGCPSTLDCAQFVGSVTEQLEVCFGLTGVALSVECS